MIYRVWNLVSKELIQFRRDLLLSTFILLAPALQLVLMARSIERGITEQPLVMLDLDHSPQSRELAARLDKSEELRVRYYVQSIGEVRDLLDRGDARVAVVIPAGFGRDLAGGLVPQQVQVIADATNSLAASTVTGAASGVVGRFASDLTVSRGLVAIELIDFRTNVRFNPTMDFREFSIPAQLGFITYQVTLAVAALGLARERELGTLEQLMVTPLRRTEFALGKGIPALAIGWLNFGVMWVIAITVFQLPTIGSPLLLALLTLVFIAAVVGWGLVISAVSRTQQQAILFVFILAMMEITFSGFIVPIKNMPAFLQFISRFSPLRHYLVIVRGIMLKGTTLGELWPSVIGLVLLSVVAGFVSIRIVTSRID
jgi:ABC-2 type transport system permease protein